MLQNNIIHALAYIIHHRLIIIPKPFPAIPFLQIIQSAPIPGSRPPKPASFPGILNQWEQAQVNNSFLTGNFSSSTSCSYSASQVSANCRGSSYAASSFLRINRSRCRFCPSAPLSMKASRACIRVKLLKKIMSPGCSWISMARLMASMCNASIACR